MGKLFALRAQSMPPFSAFPCMVPCMGPHHSHIPTFPASIALAQFPAWVTLLHKGTKYPPPCTYIPYISLHGSPPLPCTYIPCVPCKGSIPCIGDFFCNKNTVLTNMFLHSLHFSVYPAWFPVWIPTTHMYLHSLCSLHGFNSLHGDLFAPRTQSPGL